MPSGHLHVCRPNAQRSEKNGGEGMYEMFHIVNCGFVINCGIVLGKKERRKRTEVSRGGRQEH